MHQSPEQCFAGKLRVISRHGVAAQQEAICLASDKAVEKKASVSESEHNLAWAHVIRGAAGDLDYITGPKGGQHTFPPDLQP
jgi:hypothetical protein